jgi:hypothetical protein
VRIALAVPEDGPPRVTGETVVADGFGERADKDVFIIGPTGLARGKDGVGRAEALGLDEEGGARSEIAERGGDIFHARTDNDRMARGARFGCRGGCMGDHRPSRDLVHHHGQR